MATWKNAESMNEPIKIDFMSSPGNVYLRTNIKKVSFEDIGGKEINKWVYDEAFMSNEEFALYQLKNEIINGVLGIDDTEAFRNYKKKLDTPVEYPVNGFMYKPKWAEEIYGGLIEKGVLLPSLFPIKIWDASEKEECSELMGLEQLVALTVFLAGVQEQYFNEYKIEKAQGG